MAFNLRGWVQSVGPLEPVAWNDYGETPELSITIKTSDARAADLVAHMLERGGGIEVEIKDCEESAKWQ